MVVTEKKLAAYDAEVLTAGALETRLIQCVKAYGIKDEDVTEFIGEVLGRLHEWYS